MYLTLRAQTDFQHLCTRIDVLHSMYFTPCHRINHNAKLFVNDASRAMRLLVGDSLKEYRES